MAESVTYSQVAAAIAAAVPAALLRKTVLFDVYRARPVEAADADADAVAAAPSAPAGGLAVGEKSLAVRLTLGRDDASLTDADIDAAMQAVMAQVRAQTGARLGV